LKILILKTLAPAKPYPSNKEKIGEVKNINILVNSAPGYGGEIGKNMSPLHFAIWHYLLTSQNADQDNVDIVGILLAVGANPNVKSTCHVVSDVNKNDITPLYMAVNLIGSVRPEGQDNVKKIVELLLTYHADPNATNSLGQTPLHGLSNVEVFNLLVQYGAKINTQDKNGQTPLHFAVKLHEFDIMDALINKGATVDAVDNLGNTPLHLAAASSFSMTQSRTEHAFFSDPSLERKDKNLKILNFLIARGADVNKKNDINWTPLHLAVLDEKYTTIDNGYPAPPIVLDYQHVLIQVTLLCDNGADVNTPGAQMTPLLVLYMSKERKREKLAVAKYLIGKGADYTLSYKENREIQEIYYRPGNNLLHQCARSTNAEALAYFLELGLDPNKANTFGETPLHVFMHHHGGSGCSESQLQTLNTLLEKGADVNKRLTYQQSLDINNAQKLLGRIVNQSPTRGLFPMPAYFALTPLEYACIKLRGKDKLDPQVVKILENASNAQKEKKEIALHTGTTSLSSS
jgi:ankyrin repeat protein